MFRLVSLLFSSIFIVFSMSAQSPDDIEVFDHYDNMDGYIIFYPKNHQDFNQLGLTVFLHGWGSLNPINYGGWIQRIVRKGNVVIYPRYQRSLFWPSPARFKETAATGIKDGIECLSTLELKVDTSQMVYFGHSYGGVIAAYILANQDTLGFPPAHSALLSAPGTNMFRGSRLRDYSAIPKNVQLLIVSHDGDHVVGSSFSEFLFGSAKNLDRAWIQQKKQSHQDEALGDGHNECYALQDEFDNGIRNMNYQRAKRVGKINDNDTLIYWKFTDQLLDAASKKQRADLFLNPVKSIDMGKWSDQTPRKAAKIVYGQSL